MPRSPLRSTGLVATALLLAVFALPAGAQWAWRDATGRTVYSDQPPPASVKSEQILRQPGPHSQGAPAPAPDAKSTPKTYAEREMEFRKRQQERAESEKKQAEEQARSEQKSQECERMRGYLRALDEGQRIARTDSQGNREFLDDAQRAAEIQRVRDALNRSCT